MTSEPSLERLEQDVMLRIATHRRLDTTSRSAVPIGVVVMACALIAGLGVGVARAQQHQHRILASEAVVLGEDALLAPSSLLVSGP
ncbi:MAG: hypothetical protein ACREU2_03475 [Steroidobacteraceae bacterium]